MVDATFSISAPFPRAAAVRPAPAAAPFADALPASAAASTAALPAVPLSATPPGPGLAGAASAATAGSGGTAPTFAPAPAPAASAGASGSVVPAVASAATPKAASPSAFHVLLSELNPLQYVPVVGTIYRAVTGDTIPEAARFAGGLVVSGLTGGPIGIAMNLGATLIEHLAGIDPERIGDRLLAELGIGHAGPAHAAPPSLASAAPPATAVVASTPGAATAPASLALASAAPASSARAWSPAQLAAYGVTGGTDGTLRRGTVSGADVLNSLELARIAVPVAA